MTTLRVKFAADLAGIKGDLGRIQADLAEDDEVDIWKINARLDSIRESIGEVQEALMDVSARALRDVLDRERP